MIDHIYQDIPGWFSFPQFYSDMVEMFPDGAVFVEVGTYKGRSFSYLVAEVARSGKDIKCFGIDAGCWPDVEPDFDRYMAPLAGRYTKMFGGDSFDRARDFADGSIDMVFLDANHTYEFVKRDISAFLPKMKKGGVMAGHDYNEHHPGVMQAVGEAFKEFNYNPQEDVWSIML